MTVIVVRLSPIAKNVPQRSRVGFQFNHEPTVAEVTQEQLKVIQADPYLKICNFPSVAWYAAMGFDRTEVVEKSLKDEDGNLIPLKKAPETATLAVRNDSNVVTPPAPKNAPLVPSDDQDGVPKVGNTEKPKELSASSLPQELVSALVKRGKVAGKDFQYNAKPEALFAMLKSL